MTAEYSRSRTWVKFALTGLIVIALCGCESASSDATATPTRRMTRTSTAEVAVVTETLSPTDEVLPTITLPPLPSATEPPARVATSTAQPTATPTLTPTPRPTRTPTPTIPPTPDMQALAAQYPELGAILNNPEIAGVYKELLAAFQQNGQQGAMAVARQRGIVNPEGDILASLQMSGGDNTAIVTQLQGMGIKVLGTQGDFINIAVPATMLMQAGQNPGAILGQLSALQNVLGVRPPGM